MFQTACHNWLKLPSITVTNTTCSVHASRENILPSLVILYHIQVRRFRDLTVRYFVALLSPHANIPLRTQQGVSDSVSIDTTHRVSIDSIPSYSLQGAPRSSWGVLPPQTSPASAPLAPMPGPWAQAQRSQDEPKRTIKSPKLPKTYIYKNL
jgi:hypothetical protein